MASANEKKRRRPFSSPDMASALECLTGLMSRFPEADCTDMLADLVVTTCKH